MSDLYLQGISISEIETLLKKVVQEAITENSSQKEEFKLSDGKRLLSRIETAKLLGVSLVTLHKWTSQGRIKSYRIGTRIRYKANEIDSALIVVKLSKHTRLSKR